MAKQFEFWQGNGKIVHERNLLEENLIKLNNLKIKDNDAIETL